MPFTPPPGTPLLEADVLTVPNVVTCRCGACIDLCVRCWDPACPAPVCFSCLLESGMTRSELPELVNAVRSIRDCNHVSEVPQIATVRPANDTNGSVRTAGAAASNTPGNVTLYRGI